jgi:hypothetical protein
LASQQSWSPINQLAAFKEINQKFIIINDFPTVVNYQDSVLLVEIIPSIT